MDTRLQIAVQKSGRLTDHSLDLLTKCGLKYTRSRNQLMYFGENMPIDVLLVRDDDIPELVSEGTCDLGISGQNVTAEKRFADPGAFLAKELMSLDFGHCRLMTAGPEDMEYKQVEQLEGSRIATSYPNILQAYLTWLLCRVPSRSLLVLVSRILSAIWFQAVRHSLRINCRRGIQFLTVKQPS